MDKVLAIVLAGGAGKRLLPLTREHSKPMMPFGGIYRLIDISLSNCINSGLRKIYILTQYKALSLHRHLRKAWTILSPELGEFIEMLPPTKQHSDTWYLGTADAVFQNIQNIEAEGVPYVLILSADHVYKMNYAHMLAWHVRHQADLTIATTKVPPEEASRFGIVYLNQHCEVLGFEEKPAHLNPKRSCFDPAACSASMGIYLFNTSTLIKALREDAVMTDSTHDFGRDILPRLAGKCRVIAYDFVDENRKEIRYWRDVGTLDAYYEANMDLVSVTPVFNLYDEDWPIHTAAVRYPPAKFVFAQEGRRMGMALDSLVSHGCIVSGGRVNRSILSPGVRVNSYCELDECLVLDGAVIGRHSRIRRAIIDRGTIVPERSIIGYDLEADRAKGYTVTEGGIVVVSPACELATMHATSPRAHSSVA